MKVIKVSDEVFERLKEQADLGYRAIGKHIEYLLNNQADKAKTTLTSAEVEQGENKDNESWVEANPPRKAEKLPCCLGNKPCKHWVWDMNTGNGYVNTITGEVKEV